MRATTEAGPRRTPRPGPTRAVPAPRLSWRRRVEPYVYVFPTVLLMVVLMLVPIVMVIRYSLYDNVIMTRQPVLAGVANYVETLTDPDFWGAVRNTAFFTGVSVVAHLVLGMAFAMLLNTSLLSNATKAFFRVLFILPWLFTVAIIAVLWRLLLNPNGVVNYLLLQAGLIDSKVEWLASPSLALYAVTAINIARHGVQDRAPVTAQ